MPLLEQVLEHNPDTVKIVLKNLPLTSIHDYAEKAALAALAAGEQGKFWPFHDELFEHKKLNDKVIDSIAEKLGLDIEKFKKDMDSEKVKKQLRIDINDANKADVGGTPTLFVNGRKVNNRGFKPIQKMIDQELQRIKRGK